MAKCDYPGCENREAFPFTCRYCQKSYCRIHRLPENHKCEKLHMGVSPIASSKATIVEDADFTIEEGEFEEPVIDEKSMKKEQRVLDRRRRRAERKLKRQAQIDREYSKQRDNRDDFYYKQDDTGNMHSAKMPERLFRDRMFLSLIGDHFTTSYEIFDFLIGLVIIALTWAIPSVLFSQFRWLFTPFLMLIVILSYTLLIIPQKLMARRFGCKSRYVLSKIGMLITVVTAISPVRFLSPGMLVVPEINFLSKKQQGLISFIGPLVNLVIGLAYLSLGAYFYTVPTLGEISRLMLNGSLFISQLTILGLLPFGLSRGRKVYSWNKIIYFSMLIVAIGLLASSFGLQVIPF
ncbi:MAG: hypothetical protein FK733_13585 [Asgard group archaeon]|nr:hypothetical protein [Asgard group archaeon]